MNDETYGNMNHAGDADIEAANVLKCADCARSDSLVEGLDPVDHMPLTTEALAGFPDGVPTSTGANRRQFLATGVLGMASVYAASKIDWQHAMEAAVAEGAVADTNKLVIIYLNGGNDGLNMFVPTGSAYGTGATDTATTYAKSRGTIGRAKGPNVFDATANTITQLGTVPILGNPELSFAMPLVGGPSAMNVATGGRNGHPANLGIDTLWTAGNVALFPAADFTPSNQSHFEARDFWFAGLLQKSVTGWVGRWLDRYGSDANPLQAVSLDSSISKQIRTLKAPVAAVGSLSGINFGLQNVPTADINLNAEVAKLAAVATGAGNDQLGRSRSIYDLTVKVSNSLGGLNGQDAVGVNPHGYPQSDLSNKLRRAAVLLGAGLGTRVVTIDWGGFDTHGGQLASQDPQLRTLSAGLAAFQSDLNARGIGDSTMTLVFSEFGRKIAENDGAGTDHGSGGAMMLVGNPVLGGVAGDVPVANGAILTDPNDTANLMVATDFRQVYKQILGDWLGGDPNAIIPDAQPAFKRADGLAARITKV